ncbi:D-glycero-alpha-D-manno-heptose-1,7-bisphosphate 7-phosphatase [Bacteroidota bacterium]
MNKALFLDRDGVVNREKGDYIYKMEEFDILPDVPSALKQAKEKGYKIIVITNQGGIAKGIYGAEIVEEMHDVLNEKLASFGVVIDEIYYCKHNNLVGKCICRKPDSNMLEKAIARFNIDPSQSLMIGDRQRDVDAANKVGVRGILITANAGIADIVSKLP